MDHDSGRNRHWRDRMGRTDRTAGAVQGPERSYVHRNDDIGLQRLTWITGLARQGGAHAHLLLFWCGVFSNWLAGLAGWFKGSARLRWHRLLCSFLPRRRRRGGLLPLVVLDPVIDA